MAAACDVGKIRCRCPTGGRGRVPEPPPVSRPAYLATRRDGRRRRRGRDRPARGGFRGRAAHADQEGDAPSWCPRAGSRLRVRPVIDALADRDSVLECAGPGWDNHRAGQVHGRRSGWIDTRTTRIIWAAPSTRRDERSPGSSGCARLHRLAPSSHCATTPGFMVGTEAEDRDRDACRRCHRRGPG